MLEAWELTEGEKALRLVGLQRTPSLLDVVETRWLASTLVLVAVLGEGVRAEQSITFHSVRNPPKCYTPIHTHTLACPL